jgi:predicted Fe-Mo cluster-binding NifX family protein
VLYHEDCAQSLGISRPTFAKLIKQARKKMVEMVMYGKAIELTRESHNFTLVFPTDDRISVHPYFLVAKLFAFAKVEEGIIASITYKENPIYRELLQSGKEIVNDESAKGLAAGRIIPPLLEDATVLVARMLGDGIRRNIEGMGISIELSAIRDLDAIVKELSR